MLPPDDRLEELARGALHSEDIDSVADRLAADPALAARFADLVAADPLTAALTAEPPDPVPTEILDRVLSGVLRILGEASATATRTDPGESTPPPDRVPEQGACLPPTRLGRYRIRRELGRGGMGVVYEAEDEGLGRRVALKTLHPELAATRRARERFLREARALAAVEHPNVVPIYYVGEEGGVPYAVMPLLHGETLQARLDRKGRLPVEEVIRLGRDVADGLEAAHARGLIHRDLKPGNIWLDADSGRAVVLDFGLAVPSDGPGPADRSAGTPTYMAPEQARGEPLDHRADLFALGAVLYRAATGRQAFAGSTLSAVLTAVMEHHPDPPATVNPSVPPRLSALILRLLAKAPADRPGTAQLVTAELARMMEPRFTPTWRKWVRAGARLVLLCGVAVGIWAVARAPVVPPQKDPAGPVQYSGSVDLYVYRNKATKLPSLRDEGGMPLWPNDHVLPSAKVNPPAYLYLFWIDETGNVAPLYPWRVDEWGSRPENEEPVSRVDVRYPTGEAPKITGTSPATETVLMLARPTKWELSDDQVKALFAGLGPVQFLGFDACVGFEDFTMLPDDPQTRGLEKGAVPDGPLGLQLELRNRLKSQVAFSRAISFSRRGAR
jgi:hypothetical protein